MGICHGALAAPSITSSILTRDRPVRSERAIRRRKPHPLVRGAVATRACRRDPERFFGAIQRALRNASRCCCLQDAPRWDGASSHLLPQERLGLLQPAALLLSTHWQRCQLSGCTERALSHCRCWQPRFLAPGPSPTSETPP